MDEITQEQRSVEHWRNHSVFLEGEYAELAKEKDKLATQLASALGALNRTGDQLRQALEQVADQAKALTTAHEIIEAQDYDINLKNQRLDRQKATILAQTATLEWYADLKNLEDRIYQTERWRPADPDYRHTESRLYKDVVNRARRVLGMEELK